MARPRVSSLSAACHAAEALQAWATCPEKAILSNSPSCWLSITSVIYNLQAGMLWASAATLTASALLYAKVAFMHNMRCDFRSLLVQYDDSCVYGDQHRHHWTPP